MYIRKYQEATADGGVLEGYQNSRYNARNRPAHKYYRLPQEGGEPVQWFSVASVLGHVRMERVDGLHLIYDRNNSDYNDLIVEYHKQLAIRKDECFCKD